MQSNAPTDSSRRTGHDDDASSRCFLDHPLFSAFRKSTIRRVTMQFEPRPEWVRAANAGETALLPPQAHQPLDPGELRATARAELGLPFDFEDDLGDDFDQPLSLFLRAAEEEARLHPLGRWMTRRFVLRLLRVRLQLARHLEADPGVRDETIEAPVFVVGAPRTGTTLLHGLLAQNEGLRAPEGWEFLLPVPPPAPESLETDPRIRIAEEELSLPQTVTSRLEAIHRYSGRMYKECLSAMSFSFRSEEFVSRYHAPSYSSWLAGCDMQPAYEMHRLVLQILQRRMPRRTWVLKSPVHLHSLPTLLRIYPDARIVFTHRDPLTVLASVSSLIATLRWAHSDHVDPRSIGRYHLDLYTRALDELARSDAAGAFDMTRVTHCRYADLTRDPLDTIAPIHDDLDLEFSPESAAAVERRLRDNPADAHGRHRYALEDFAIDASDAKRGLARYGDHFGIPIGTTT